MLLQRWSACLPPDMDQIRAWLVLGLIFVGIASKIPVPARKGGQEAFLNRLQLQFWGFEGLDDAALGTTRARRQQLR